MSKKGRVLSLSASDFELEEETERKMMIDDREEDKGFMTPLLSFL